MTNRRAKPDRQVFATGKENTLQMDPIDRRNNRIFEYIKGTIRLLPKPKWKVPKDYSQLCAQLKSRLPAQQQSAQATQSNSNGASRLFSSSYTCSTQVLDTNKHLTQINKGINQRPRSRRKQNRPLCSQNYCSSRGGFRYIRAARLSESMCQANCRPPLSGVFSGFIVKATNSCRLRRGSNKIRVCHQASIY